MSRKRLIEIAETLGIDDRFEMPVSTLIDTIIDTETELEDEAELDMDGEDC